MLAGLGKQIEGGDTAKLDQYRREQESIKREADEKQHSSESHLRRHSILARSVTFFQVAIAVGAIAVLVRHRGFWYASLGFGTAGALSLMHGLIVA